MLSPSLEAKLLRLVQRAKFLAEELCKTEVLTNRDKLQQIGKEYSELEEIVKHFQVHQECTAAIAEMEAWPEEAELAEMVEQEIALKKELLEEQERLLKLALLPQDPLDAQDVFLELRAGAGGTEATLFAAELFRMYCRFAELQGWQAEIVSAHESELGGFKEMILRVSGNRVYSQLKFESGGHRVQRVPVTEAQGRVHTSACTVAVLPVAEEITSVVIDPKDLSIDTYRASGAGGQHVNRTESAIRITHLPTKTVVECQEDRSQHKNKARAMAVLKAKLLQSQRSQQAKKTSDLRQSLVGSGDRSERIRTYNFPQGRVTDHRIHLTIYDLQGILDGQLIKLTQPLSQEYQASQLADLG